MPFLYGNYYYIIFILQGFCAIHTFRRGTQSKWIWLIIFLPLLGSVIYIYSEILSNGNIRKPNINVGAVFNPGGKIKKLEEQLHFTDTFNNRVQLADAYLAAGYTDKAVELYKGSLTGAFAENEHVQMQLMAAYFEQEHYDKVIAIGKKIYKLQQFLRSKAHLTYAKSLEETGNIEQAESEFKLMKGRYSYFGQRYEYGLFLVRQDRNEDARTIFTEMLNEEPHLSQIEKRSNRIWFAKTKEELRKL